jgi:hypothetical protein
LIRTEINKKNLPKAQTTSHRLGLQHVRDGSFIAISSFAGNGMDGGREGTKVVAVSGHPEWEWLF